MTYNRPAARVRGLVGGPGNETEKSSRRHGGSSAARTTKSTCTHCWAAFGRNTHCFLMAQQFVRWIRLHILQ